jgi:hypothetical protein
MKRSLSEHFAEATDRTEEEETLLPDSADRLAARDKLARLALNGGYLSLFTKSSFDGGLTADRQLPAQ